MFANDLQRKRIFAVEKGHSAFVILQTGTCCRHTLRLADIARFTACIACRCHQNMAWTNQLRDTFFEEHTIARQGIEPDAISDDARHLALVSIVEQVLHQREFVGRTEVGIASDL